MDYTADGERIRSRMAEVRRELDEDVNGIVENARTLTSWRYYVRKYPWACMAGAAALGYLAVPRQYEIHSPDAETLEKLARKNRLVVKHKPEVQARGGLVGGLFSLTSGLLVRGLLAYIGRKVGGAAGRTADAQQEQDEKPESPQSRPAGSRAAAAAPAKG